MFDIHDLQYTRKKREKSILFIKKKELPSTVNMFQNLMRNQTNN